MKNRQENKEFWSNELYKKLELDKKTTDLLSYTLDAGYCEGYNTVLDAAEKVLSSEDYWKIVNYLDEHNC